MITSTKRAGECATLRKRAIAVCSILWSLALVGPILPSALQADETCSSPYLARIEGQEEFVYV